MNKFQFIKRYIRQQKGPVAEWHTVFSTGTTISQSSSGTKELIKGLSALGIQNGQTIGYRVKCSGSSGGYQTGQASITLNTYGTNRGQSGFVGTYSFSSVVVNGEITGSYTTSTTVQICDLTTSNSSRTGDTAKLYIANDRIYLSYTDGSSMDDRQVSFSIHTIELYY